jgi:hypothetical protein
VARRQHDHECGDDHDLTLDEYRGLGGIKGSVERALNAADGNPAIPNDKQARLALLRRGLIPWLAGIDPDTGAPRRRVARLSEIPAEAQPLIRHLVEQRLLATDVAKDIGETTIEPAHEALLRQWGVLQGWLEEDAVALRVLESIKSASREWYDNGMDEPWLVHTSGRLEDAERLGTQPDLSANLEPTDRAYLAACRARENADHDAKVERLKKLRRATLAAGGLGVLVLAAIGVALTYYAQLTGKCAVANMYTYKTGRFEKRGSTWFEYKGPEVVFKFVEPSTLTELIRDARYIYIADDTRKEPESTGNETQRDRREMIVRIPRCGGQADWTWSNPLDWIPFQIVKPTPLTWGQLVDSPASIDNFSLADLVP